MDIDFCHERKEMPVRRISRVGMKGPLAGIRPALAYRLSRRNTIKPRFILRLESSSARCVSPNIPLQEKIEEVFVLKKPTGDVGRFSQLRALGMDRTGIGTVLQENWGVHIEDLSFFEIHMGIDELARRVREFLFAKAHRETKTAGSMAYCVRWIDRYEEKPLVTFTLFSDACYKEILPILQKIPSGVIDGSTERDFRTAAGKGAICLVLNRAPDQRIFGTFIDAEGNKIGSQEK